MFFFLFLALMITQNITPTPWPSSMSGVPSWTVVFATLFSGVAVILIMVLILCFVKVREKNTLQQSNQTLLDKSQI